MKNYLLTKLAILGCATLFTVCASAQCKGFTKRNCLPGLEPYLSNGQLNATKMSAGQEAIVQLNFNKGLSYRLIVCADPYFENTIYEIKSMENKVLATDTIKKTFAFEDIEVDKTQPLILSIQLPKSESTTDIVRDGCVTILVGFKDD